MTTMTVEATGAYLHQEAVAKGYGTAQAGSLFLHITRYDRDWALELNDDEPVWQSIRDEWAIAVGVPGAPQLPEWRFESNGKVARCEWQGNEDPATAGTPAFFLGGAR